MTLVEHETAAAYAALLRGELDFAITFDYDRAPQPAPVGLVRTRLFEDPVLVVLPASHRLAGRSTVELAEIPAGEWSGTPVTQIEHELLTELPGATGPLHFRGDDFRTAVRLVAEGLGAALLPALALASPAPGVVGIPLTGKPLTRRVYTCRLDSRRTHPALTTFHECLRWAACDVTGAKS